MAKNNVTLKDLLAALRADHPSGGNRSFAVHKPDTNVPFDDGDVPRKGHVGELWKHNYRARPDITPPPPPYAPRRRRPLPRQWNA